MADEHRSDRIKHLEMIQAVVARLASEAALIKGWALTVSAAFFGLAAQSLSARIAAVGLLPILVFWVLNAYYLRAERQYRKLFDHVRLAESAVDFDMDARTQTVDSWSKTMFSATLCTFYGIIFVVGVILVVVGICKV